LVTMLGVVVSWGGSFGEDLQGSSLRCAGPCLPGGKPPGGTGSPVTRDEYAVVGKGGVSQSSGWFAIDRSGVASMVRGSGHFRGCTCLASERPERKRQWPGHYGPGTRSEYQCGGGGELPPTHP